MSLTENEVLSTVAGLLEAQTGVGLETLNPDWRLTDVCADSLGLMALVVGTEDRLGVRIPQVHLGGLHTVGDLVRHVVACSAEAT